MTATLGILICLILFSGLGYNKIIKNDNLIKEAWGGVDVQLKKRHDLVPALVEIIKGYAKHEKEALLKTVALRNTNSQSSDSEPTNNPENNIANDLRHIFALTENYPDLKANENFLELQSSLSDIEDQLQFARRYYNGTVRDFNVLIQSFPLNLLAAMFGFASKNFFEIEYATERNTPDVKF